MAGVVEGGLQGIGQALRIGWYFGLNRIVDWQTQRLSPKRAEQSRAEAEVGSNAPRRQVPPTQEILADLGQLVLRDADAVRAGIYPPMLEAAGLTEHLSRARAMLADLPSAVQRRSERDAGSARQDADTRGLPEYFTQDFHFQTGGYLTEQSARLYDVQVETLFLGGAQLMRREALRPIANFMRGRDQRKVSLLDVPCGTGRFLRDCRIAWPAMRLTGLDLSDAYVSEARRHLEGLRPAELVAANAEAMPFADASQDIVVSIYLFHELPPGVRRRVAAEMARVLKPGGMLVFIDSLQHGDRPRWDGLLDAFPARFHEPYYRNYLIDELDAVFRDAGLVSEASWTSFFSKVMVRRKG
jgi:ubiquinone/menaquinone biosynthesis C-methylase UbiE